MMKGSPDVKKEVQAPARPAFPCPEVTCDRHSHGFDSEGAMKYHHNEEHIKPQQDPLGFVQGSLTMLLGLDANGQPQRAPIPISGPTSAPKMDMSSSKQGATPKDRMAPSPASTNKDVQNKPGFGPKISQPSPNTATKADEKQTEDMPLEDPWSTSGMDPDDVLKTFGAFDSAPGFGLTDAGAYRSATPNDTPESSKDGLSEPNSDISENLDLHITMESGFADDWQPFGMGDYGMGDIDSGVYDMEKMNVNASEEVDMFAEPPPMNNINFGDFVVDFDKPFVFDTSHYSMNAES